MELRYEFPWGQAWSTNDALGGSSSIGVRFRREPSPSAQLVGYRIRLSLWLGWPRPGDR
jgi:hypothetical protein